MLKKKFKFALFFTLFLPLLIGISLLYFGIKDKIEMDNKTNDYVLIDSYYYNYIDNGENYSLYYYYVVNNKYYLHEYKSNYIPEKYSVKKLKYNPNNPSESVLIDNYGESLIVFGSIFTIFPLFFIIILATNFGVIKIKKNNELFKLLIGIIFIILTLGVVYVFVGSLSIKKIIEEFGVISLGILLFLVLGLYLVLDNLRKMNEID